MAFKPMLTLDRHIKLTEDAIQGDKASNLCNRFDTADLQRIGNYVHEGYSRDKRSRHKWETRTQAAMDLAMQVQKDKNFPWPGCSNVAFPLITIAALQFHSRAYPALIQGTDIVKYRVIGQDPTGEKRQRADRVSMHMSWQVLEEDKCWEEQKDRLLINLPIVGTTFSKKFFNAEVDHQVGETVLAQDFVLDYWAKSVESCPRKTHIIPFFRNQVHSNMKRGVFRDVSEEAWYGQPPPPKQQDPKRDNRLGVAPPEPDETTPYLCLEQHVELDLDGDGYAEPYIITVEDASKSVLRIVTGFDRIEDIEYSRQKEIISIRRMEYFTKYSFIPSPDGGIYDVGFGVLLGPLNESTNSVINQLIDAGTWSITAGGFLGRGAKFRGGVYTFAPREWKRVDSSGEDIQKSVYPLPVREPSMVLFQLLSLLINYVNRIAGTTDTMVGEDPGQNTTAETMRTMVEQGTKIYTAVFKRVWRSMKEEFKKGYILNAIFMPPRKSFGEGQMVLHEDYLGNPDEVVPVADPNITSEQMQMAQVQMLKASAASTPGYNVEEVERRFLKAIKVDGIDQVYPGIDATGMPKDVKLQIQEMKTQVAMAELQSNQAEFAATLMEEQRMNNAEIIKIAAEVENMKATQEGDVEDRKIGVMNAVLGMLKTRNEVLMKRIEVILKSMELKREQSADGGDVGGLARASGNGGAAKGSSAAQAAAA